MSILDHVAERIVGLIGDPEVSPYDIAAEACSAHIEALEQAGFAFVAVGEIPHWMQQIPGAGWRDQSELGYGITGTVVTNMSGDSVPEGTDPLYRFSLTTTTNENEK